VIKRTSILLIAAALLAPGLAGSFTAPAFAHDHDKQVGAAIVGGIVGVAVGAALSKKHKHRDDVYYPGYRPAYPPGAYNRYWNAIRVPQRGVTCYDAQRTCYSDSGDGYSRKWTLTIYGR